MHHHCWASLSRWDRKQVRDIEMLGTSSIEQLQAGMLLRTSQRTQQ